MDSEMKAYGLLLLLIAVLGAAFILATDPQVVPQGAKVVGWPTNVVDASREAIAGTALGLAGAAAIGLIGLWLLVRKAI